MRSERRKKIVNEGKEVEKSIDNFLKNFALKGIRNRVTFGQVYEVKEVVLVFQFKQEFKSMLIL